MPVLFKPPSRQIYNGYILSTQVKMISIVARLVQLWFLAFSLASIGRIPPSTAGEVFTVVTSDSSSLVDTPQTGFPDRARTDPEEQKAVYEIMAATGNEWASSISDVCRGRWHGIKCMSDKDEVYHVVSISFGALSDDTAFPVCDQSRSTHLSSAFTKLPYIQSIFFYRCFTGNPRPIPAFLGRLGSSLQSLVLRENGHVGEIPAELGNLKMLKLLDLHGNSLSSSIPPSIGDLHRLESLDLSENRLSGAVTHLIFPNLKVLDLSGNRLQGRIPPTVGGCSTLIKMDLSRNRFSGPIPNTITNLKSLILLDLSENQISGPLPFSLTGLQSLRSLVLNDNPMGPSSIASNTFVGLENLEILVLSNMGLQGSLPESIGILPALHVLHLDNNRISGAIPLSYRRLERIGELRLNDNRLTGPLPFSRRMLWKLGKKLRISNNSNLCYHAGDFPGDSAGSFISQGISSCQALRAAAVKTTSGSAMADANGEFHP